MASFATPAGSMSTAASPPSMVNVLTRPSPFGNETGSLPNGEFEPSPQLLQEYREYPILVIGAGGLGCELLKDLALSGFRNLQVIDMDTIDVSNLNRQFLFRQKDVGRPKAEVAAAFIEDRVAGCKVQFHCGKIQDFPESFYAQFRVIVCGLDNIEARRWLNSLLVGMVAVDEDGDIDGSTIVPMIDGGTEGLKGQARVILPRVTSCFECSMDSFPPQKGVPVCSIMTIPRCAEHCILIALEKWDLAFPDRKLDNDSPSDMQWVFEGALEVAEKFNLEGVTYFKTLGVVKNIIPAVASTNAIIAAACVNEVLKMLTFCSQSMNNFMIWSGGDGCYSNTFDYEKKEECPVCGDSTKPRTVNMPTESTFEEFLQMLAEDSRFQLKKPSCVGQTRTLYMRAPPALREATTGNLAATLGALLQQDEVVTVTDPALSGVSLSILVHQTGYVAREEAAEVDDGNEAKKAKYEA